MADIAVVGLDIGKRLFHLVGMDRAGRVVLRRRCSRSQLFAFFERLPPALVGMEACASAHFVGRTIRELGHDARLIPAQFVKPFLKSQKNDYLDAEAIAEAVQRPTMRFVPIKTPEQLGDTSRFVRQSTPGRTDRGHGQAAVPRWRDGSLRGRNPRGSLAALSQR